MTHQNGLSPQASEFINEVHGAIAYWHDRPLLADLGSNPTRARLLGLAADLIRLIDSADTRGWDMPTIAYEAVLGPDGEADADHVDVLLSKPMDDIEVRFDLIAAPLQGGRNG